MFIITTTLKREMIMSSLERFLMGFILMLLLIVVYAQIALH
jgi:hypothetical protein